MIKYTDITFYAYNKLGKQTYTISEFFKLEEDFIYERLWSLNFDKGYFYISHPIIRAIRLYRIASIGNLMVFLQGLVNIALTFKSKELL